MNKTPRIILGFIHIVLWVVETFLTLRFILRLFDANTSAPFVNFIYNSTGPLLQPFRGIFPSPVLQQGFIVEFSTLFAIIIYSLISYLIIALIEWVSRFEQQGEHKYN